MLCVASERCQCCRRCHRTPSNTVRSMLFVWRILLGSPCLGLLPSFLPSSSLISHLSSLISHLSSFLFPLSSGVGARHSGVYCGCHRNRFLGGLCRPHGTHVRWKGKMRDAILMQPAIRLRTRTTHSLSTYIPLCSNARITRIAPPCSLPTLRSSHPLILLTPPTHTTPLQVCGGGRDDGGGDTGSTV